MTTTSFHQIPSILGFFQCLETSGNILHDSITNGLTWDISERGDSLIFDTESGGIGCTLNSLNPVNFQNGVCPVLNTEKDYLFFFSGRITGETRVRCAIGDVNELLPEYSSNGIGWGASDGPFHSIVGGFNGTDYAYIEVIESSNASLSDLANLDVSVAVRYSGINNTLLYEAYDSHTNEKIMEALTYTANTPLGNVQPNPCFRFNGVELYGVIMWEFTQFPPDTVDAFLWMGKRWALGRGYRDIYPAWAGPGSCGLGMR